jgi:hypothetical protein
VVRYFRLPVVSSGLGPTRLDGLRSGLGRSVIEHTGAMRLPYLTGKIVELIRPRVRNGARYGFRKH